MLAVTSGGLDAFLGDGRGRFTKIRTTGALAGRVALADFQGDGILDAAVGGAGFSTGPGVVRGNGDGTFAAASVPPDDGTHVRDVVTADVNGDGRADIVVAALNSEDSGRLKVYHGRADGGFDSGYGIDLTFGITDADAADFNADGAPDLALATASGLKVVLGQLDQGKPNGTFGVPVSYGTPAYVVRAGDVDGDGQSDDVAVAALGSADVSVLLGGVGGALGAPVTYAAPAGSGPSIQDAPTLADIDNDGISDLTIADYGKSVRVLFADGDGGFEDPMSFPGQIFATLKGLVAGDFNGDDVVDVVVNDDHSSRMYLMRNAPFLAFSTDELAFGGQRVQTPSPARAVLAANVGIAPLDMSVVNVLGEGFAATDAACVGVRLAFAEGCVMGARFTPFEPGEYEGALEFASNDVDSLLYVLLTGVGEAAPPLSSSPPPPAPPPPTAAPATAGAAARAAANAARSAVRKLGLRGLAQGRSATLQFDAPAVTVRVEVRAEAPQPTRTAAQARMIIAAIGRARLLSPGRATVRVRPTQRGKRLARRARRLNLEIRAQVTPANGAPARQTVRLQLTSRR